MPRRKPDRRRFETKTAMLRGPLCVCGKAACSKSEATREMKRIGYRNVAAGRGDGPPLNVYECPLNPGVYHIGHTPKRLREAR